MNGLNPSDPSSFERLEEAIERIAPEWSGDPNVVGIAPVLKVSGQRVDPESLVIGFYVREKLPPEELAERGLRPVPAEIEGIATDVILARQRAHGSIDERNTRSQMFDTLIGGIAVGNADRNAYGTLALTLLAESDGRMVGLTNEHVLVYDNEGQVGDEVQQPRFYLNSEVSLDNASCCPNGVLHYRGVDNPVVDAAAAVFTAAAIAAAASDEIDPHRRGQDATVPDPGERTLSETVAMSVDYPQIPLPGTPYKVGVDWTYQRHTDRRVLDHSVSEEQGNPHVISVQHLLTDKRQYLPRETVDFLALLGPEHGSERCGNYFVTAAALSPSHRRAYKIILRPFVLEHRPERAWALSHGQAGHSIEDRAVKRCFDYERQGVGERFSAPRLIDGVTYEPHRTAMFVRDGSGRVAIRLPQRGLTITLPRPVERVILRLDLNLREPVVARAFAAGEQVDEGEAAPANGPTEAEIVLAGDAIERVELTGGGKEALLWELCVEADAGRACLYRGSVTLAPDEEPGPWSTYVFAQTTNDVSLGTDPLAAAPTIGGLPVTHNFASVGGSDDIAHGHACNVDIAADGSFEVLEPSPEG